MLGGVIVQCKVCQSNSDFFGYATILRKYKVNYYKCSRCGFITTEEPYWLQEAYQQPINISDVGLINRNIRLASITKAIICVLFDKRAKFLDYGGGYGMFVRLMRDFGLDFLRYDKFCENLFAKGFDDTLVTKYSYRLVTAFELFEHIHDPVYQAIEIRNMTSNLLFTTEILPDNDNPPVPGNWWYYGLDHGQHISFFTLKSLTILAEQLGLNLYSDHRSIHLLSAKRFPNILFKALCRYKVASIVGGFFRTPSLLEQDYKMVVESICKGHNL